MALIGVTTEVTCAGDDEDDKDDNEDNMALIRTPTTDSCSEEDDEDDEESEHPHSVAVASPRNKDVIAAYDSICVNDSKEIQVGSKNVYHGHVTINHIVYPGASEVPTGVDLDTNVCETSRAESESASNENLLPTNSHKKKAWWKCSCILLFVILCTPVVFGVLFAFGVFHHADHSLDDGIHFVTRTEWKGRDPIWLPFLLDTPVSVIIIAHTGGQGCNDSTSCSKRVRALQDYFMDSLQFVDIGYHFLIGVDGLVYIGRGWNMIGLHTQGYDMTSICIAFIGDFNEQIPTAEQLKAVKLLIDKGLKLWKIFGFYTIYSQCQLKNDSSPGKYINEAVSNWTHYNNTADHKYCTFP